MSNVSAIQEPAADFAASVLEGYDEVSPPFAAAARLFTGSTAILGLLASVAVDFFLGVPLMFAGWLGWRGFNSGAIRSLLALTGMLAVFAWSVPVGKWLSGSLQGVIDWPVVPTRYLSIVLSSIAILLGGHLLGRLMGWIYHSRHGQGGRRTRSLGMVFGLGEGALLGVTVLLGLLAIEPSARIGLSMVMDDSVWARSAYDRLVWLRRTADSTIVGQELAQYSEDRRQVLEIGGSLALISKYPGALNNLKKNEVVLALIESNEPIRRVAREIRKDLDLKAAVESGNLEDILNSPTVLRILEDERLAEAVEAYRDELFEAILVSVPPVFQEVAIRELAIMHGMPVKEFATHAQRRIASLRADMDGRGQAPVVGVESAGIPGDQIQRRAGQQLEDILHKVSTEDVTDALDNTIDEKPK